MTTWNKEINRLLWSGTILLIALCGGVGGWAATTEISGAVVAPGVLVVESNVRKVQHPNGGIVGEIRARDGVEVRSGDLLVRLDETIARANFAIVDRTLAELAARRARLEAERDGLDVIAFPPELLTRADTSTVAAIINGEGKLFDLRRSVRVGQRAQLRQRIDQLREEIGGLKAQAQAKAKEIVLIERELTGARELWDKNLMPITKLTLLEREAARIEGERAFLIATTAQANGKIAELELQVIQVDQELASEVGKELRDIDAKMAELAERKTATEDQLKRIDIRAPHDGVVHQSIVHTVGGVVGAGETIMLIVPSSEVLIVEARVAPQDIDQIQLDQNVRLRFSAFSQHTTPELNGKVSRISADISLDARTSISFYSIRISLSRDEVRRLGNIKLIPGMPVETFIQTGDRKVISYLVKPLHDQITRAFRER